MSVPREHEGGFRHLLALFSMYGLQTLVLLTCLFCPVQAVPSRDLPTSVPREHEGGFHHLLALFSMYGLQTVRMAILSNGV